MKVEVGGALIEVERISLLDGDIRPSDVLVMQADRMTADQAQRIKESVTSLLGCRCMIVSGEGLEVVGVARPTPPGDAG